MKKSESTTFRSIIYIVSTFFVQGATVIFAPVYTRILAPGETGYYSVYLSIVNIISIICGLQTQGSLLVKKNELSEVEYEEYCVSILALSTVGYFVSVLVVLLTDNFWVDMLDIRNAYVIIMVSHAFGMYCVNFLYAYFIADQKVVTHLCVSVLLTVGTFLLSVLFTTFCASNHKYFGMYLGNAIPNIIAGIIIWMYFVIFMRRSITVKYWKFCIDYSFPLIFHNLAALLLVQADRIMIKDMESAGAAGIYSMCYNMALPTSALWSAMNNAWKTDYFRKQYEGDIDYIQLHSRRYLKTYTLATMGYLMIFPEIVRIMLAKEYWEGIMFIPLIIVNCYFIFLYSFPANFEIVNKKTKGLSTITVFGATANIALNYFMIPHFGMTGAALATLAVQILIFIAHDILARYYIGQYHFKWSFYLCGIIPVLIGCAGSYLFMDHIWIRWGLAVVIGLLALHKLIKDKSLF